MSFEIARLLSDLQHVYQLVEAGGGGPPADEQHHHVVSRSVIIIKNNLSTWSLPSLASQRSQQRLAAIRSKLEYWQSVGGGRLTVSLQDPEQGITMKVLMQDAFFLARLLAASQNSSSSYQVSKRKKPFC